MVESRSAASRETVRLKSLALSNGTVVDLDHASMCKRLDHLSAHGMELTVDSMIHQASRAEMQDLQLDL
jgi:cell division septal protein FtsQ